jgi:hypothetical protein
MGWLRHLRVTTMTGWLRSGVLGLAAYRVSADIHRTVRRLHQRNAAVVQKVPSGLLPRPQRGLLLKLRMSSV